MLGGFEKLYARSAALRDASPTKPRDIRKSPKGVKASFPRVRESPSHTPPHIVYPRKMRHPPLAAWLPYNASMAQDDFDIDRLAAYLHMMPAAVQKLAERGKLPGRRIGGDWRFSTAEIHHWLEDRIGLSDEEGLVHMEGALDNASDRVRRRTSFDCQSAETRSDRNPARSPHARQRRRANDRARRPHRICFGTQRRWPTPCERAKKCIPPRSTTASPCCIRAGRCPAILAEALLALGISPGGIPFGTNGRLTDIFFLICSTSDHEHLRILARLSRVINDQDFLTAMRQAHNPVALHKLVKEREATIRET